MGVPSTRPILHNRAHIGLVTQILSGSVASGKISLQELPGVVCLFCNISVIDERLLTKVSSSDDPPTKAIT